MQEPEAPLDDRPIAEMVAEALARRGIEAVVVQKNDGIEMYGKGGEPLFLEAARDINAWTTLPAALRQRKAHALATRLAHMHQSRAAAKEPARRLPPKERLIPLGVGLGLGLLAFLAFRLMREEPKPPPKVESSAESPKERGTRLARACEATRAMLWKGGPWGAMPLEGWVVELWLARKGDKPLSADPALQGVLESGKISVKGDATIAAIGDGAAGVEESAADADIPGALIVMREGYARAFFEFNTRPRFVGLGERLVRETKADYGALWARCAHQSARVVGAWFYGRDAKHAATSLLFAMGRTQSPAAERHAPVAERFGMITALADRLDEPGFFSLVQEGGARTSTSEGYALVFPFDPQTRAGQTSQKLAEKLGL